MPRSKRKPLAETYGLRPGDDYEMGSGALASESGDESTPAPRKRVKRKLVQGAAAGASRDALAGAAAQPGDLGPNWAEFDHSAKISALSPEQGQRDRQYTSDYIESGAQSESDNERDLGRLGAVGSATRKRNDLLGFGQAASMLLPGLGSIAGVGESAAVRAGPSLAQGADAMRRSGIPASQVQAADAAAGRMSSMQLPELPDLPPGRMLGSLGDSANMERLPGYAAYDEALANQLPSQTGMPSGVVDYNQASRVTPRVGRGLEPRSQFPEPSGGGLQGETKIYGQAPWAVPEELPQVPFGGRQPIELKQGYEPRQSFYNADHGEAQFDEGAARAIAKDDVLDNVGRADRQRMPAPTERDVDFQGSIAKNPGPAYDYRDFSKDRPLYSLTEQDLTDLAPGSNADHFRSSPTQQPFRRLLDERGDYPWENWGPGFYPEPPIVQPGPVSQRVAAAERGDLARQVYAEGMRRVRSIRSQNEWLNGVPNQMPPPPQFAPPDSGMTTMSPTRISEPNILTPEPLPPLDMPVQPQEMTPNDLGVQDNLFSADTAGGFQGTAGARPSNVGQQNPSSYDSFDAQMAPLQQQLRARGQGPVPSQPMDSDLTTEVMTPDELLRAINKAPGEQAQLEVLKKADPSVVARVINRLPDDLRLALLVWGIAGGEGAYLAANTGTSTAGPGQ